MNTKRSARVIGGIAALSFLVISASSAAASPDRNSMTRHTEIGAQRTSHITITLGASNLLPNEQANLLVAVTPARRGRTVTVKEVVGHRLIPVGQGTTNRLGQVTVRITLRQTGTVRFRAFVDATPAYSGTGSRGVNETVAAILPLAFPERLGPGATGHDVLLTQQRLSALGYWLGTPSGVFDDATVQAVYALEKAAGLPRGGVVGAPELAAINSNLVPHPRSTSGDAIDIDLQRDLIMIVHGGSLQTVLNTSTGGGYTYVQTGVAGAQVADTPTGVFHLLRVVNGLVVDTLGQLWRPRFFDAGYAIHGDSYVPPEPVSHGCARVSNEAIDWIWATNQAPIGIEVWVY